jgi:hypothetical protein
MNLHNHFDVAHLLGHPAFEHLAEALKVYEHARREGSLEVAAHNWPECLGRSARLHQLRTVELKQCVQAIILFQAMMEKIPHFVVSIGSGLVPAAEGGFARTWENLILQIKNPRTQAAAKAEFDAYHNDFYKAYRNPIVHGKSTADITKINQIRVTGVYDGMRHGWRSYDYLLSEVFAPQQSHEASWSVMCNAHAIPDNFDGQAYPDLLELESQFVQKHLEGARAACGSD